MSLIDVLDNRLRRVENRAVANAHTALRPFWRKLKRLLDQREVSEIIAEDLAEALQEDLAQSLLETYAEGIRTAHIVAARRKVSKETQEVIENLRRSGDVNRLQRLLGTRAFDAIQGAGRHLNNELRAAISETVERGMTQRGARRFLRQRLRDIGYAPESSHNIDTAVRTQAAIVYNSARWNAGQSMGVWGWTYVTMRDERVRPEHAEIDGVTLPNNHPFWNTWYPPNGWNCRCQCLANQRPRKPVYPDRELIEEPDASFAHNFGKQL